MNKFSTKMIKIPQMEKLRDKAKTDSGKYKITNVYIREKGWKINKLSTHFKLGKKNAAKQTQRK